MNYEIKLISDEELNECASVIRLGFLTVAREFGLTRENCPTNGAFITIERLSDDKEKGHMMFGMLLNKRLIGFIQLEKCSDTLYYLHKLVVLPKYRHQGFGKILLNYVKEMVLKLGGNLITIGIIEENTILKNWYMDYGFQPTIARKFKHLPFTVGYMELKLS